jgi:hypothetical protein
MSESKSEPKRKLATAADIETAEPIHTIRDGAVAASIWQRQSTSGYAYFDFSLSRTWLSMSSKKPAFSKSFFTRNQPELLRVIEKACAWIKEHEPPAHLSLGATSDAGAAHDAHA